VRCLRYSRIVRVRSGEDRRDRYVSKYRSDKREEITTGVYRIANVRQGVADKKFKKTTEE